MKPRGFSSIILIALLAVVIAGGVYYFANGNLENKSSSSSKNVANFSSITSTSSGVSGAYDWDSDYKKYFPADKYNNYSIEIRSSLRSADMEDYRCRGGHRDDPGTTAACKQRDTLMGEIKKQGWCWGGSEISAEQHWLLCKADKKL